MLRDFEDCIEIEHGKRKFNFDKIYAVFNNELNDKNRLLSKLKDKNKVLKHQKAKLLRSVRQYMEDKEITGLALQLPSLNTQSCINKIWAERNSAFLGCLGSQARAYSKLSIIRPGRSMLLEFEKKIVLVV